MSVSEQQKQMYAIVRVDVPKTGTASAADEWRNIVTVKGIVDSMETAILETDRLNSLNGSKGCLYFWQTTRVLDGAGA